MPGDYDDETHDPMIDIRDEIPKLRDRHKRAVDVFLARGDPQTSETSRHVSISWRM